MRKKFLKKVGSLKTNSVGELVFEFIFGVIFEVIKIF